MSPEDGAAGEDGGAEGQSGWEKCAGADGRQEAGERAEAGRQSTAKNYGEENCVQHRLPGVCGRGRRAPACARLAADSASELQLERLGGCNLRHDGHHRVVYPSSNQGHERVAQARSVSAFRTRRDSPREGAALTGAYSSDFVPHECVRARFVLALHRHCQYLTFTVGSLLRY